MKLFKLTDHVYILPYDEKLALWVGGRLSKEEASEISDVKDIRDYNDFDSFIDSILDYYRGLQDIKIYLDIFVDEDGNPSKSSNYGKELIKKYPHLMIKDSFPFTTICLHGNHEYRPTIDVGYDIVKIQQSDYIAGRFFQQEQFEKILFVADGTVITLDSNRCLCLGGAYSVDKHYRLHMQELGNYDYKWYQDEQTPQALRNDILFLTKSDSHYDYVFSHTCAASVIPTEMFLKNVDQSQVDRSQEDWLEEIKNNITYKKWYCGHWHTDKIVDNTRFLYNDFIELGG